MGIITTSFATRKPLGFFTGKKAISIVKQSNIGGDEIEKGSIVIIIGQGRTKNDLNIRDEKTGVEIYNVWCEQLELIKDDNNQN
ncbi:hypothetical protein [Flavobacterium sp. UMI-01]|uniref:hypothetical protein n=1 Tax=Flavobacterium sp. UMI-01 TaxID=1441053 RepID=UPI001C7D006A|nr:hypothetical protein [Flavobacterium sp. UMI-01]GIZ09919.1 hypothetical protein FUMI01_26450 [Flavobacterium sp. UMI-01]GIZ10008.1 hypothetical protein FUMI01_27340 [Flavobacterium sp. UMI-01]GIZ10259.1 hypothetical protein FUMI01_29830 [Flavobacterium sp. UMI-01]